MLMISGTPASSAARRAMSYSRNSQRSGGISDHSSVFKKPPLISAMCGIGTGAASTEIVLESRPPAPPRITSSSMRPSRTFGPAAGSTGLRNVSPQMVVTRSAIFNLSDYQEPRHETRDTRHETRDTRHETRDTRHETRDTRHETREPLVS